MALLEVRNLRTRFQTDEGEFNAVDGISFAVEKGKTLGIVGESGCGKSVTSLSLLRLIQSPGEIVDGAIIYEGRDLMKISEEEMRKLRGRQIAMIFQEPMNALNPVYTIGNQMIETIRLHKPQLSKAEAREIGIGLLKKVGIPSPEKRFDEYIFRLSGGMRQRVMIAISIASEPQLLIADEPTTALDVTIQAQILDLMRKLKSEIGTGLILITHDLGVVAEMCDDVAVMYAGQIVEQGTVNDIFDRPKHPYTRGLLDSIPHFETGQRKEKLNTIPGLVPSLTDLPVGCRFNERCRFATQKCREVMPVLETHGSQKFACFHPLPETKTAGVHP